MKKREITDKEVARQSAWGGLLLIIVAVVTLEATSLTQYFFSRRGIKQEATQRAESELEATELKIMDVVNQAEAAVRNCIWIAQWCLDRTDSLYRVPERVVMDNPVVVGSTLAVVPNHWKNKPALVAP